MVLGAVLPGSRWVIHSQVKRVNNGLMPILGDWFTYEGLGYMQTSNHKVHILRVEDATELEAGKAFYCSPDFFIQHFMPG